MVLKNRFIQCLQSNISMYKYADWIALELPFDRIDWKNKLNKPGGTTKTPFQHGKRLNGAPCTS